MSNEPDLISQEFAKIAANFSQQKKDNISQELAAIAAEFAKRDELSNLSQYEDSITSYHKAPDIQPNDHKALYNRDIALDNLRIANEYIPSEAEILEILKSLSFPEIIKEYPDSIKDIYDNKEKFISKEKLLNHWANLKNQGKQQEIIPVASQWSKHFVSQQLLNQNCTKNQLFEQVNLSSIINSKLIDSSNIGLTINPKGKTLNENNITDGLIISNLSYEIIRILMVEIIWQIIRQQKISPQSSSNSHDQGVYTVEWLQQNFESFQAAKEHFDIAAQGWQKLAEKLNQR